MLDSCLALKGVNREWRDLCRCTGILSGDGWDTGHKNDHILERTIRIAVLQLFPQHVLHFPWLYTRDSLLVQSCRCSPLHYWCAEWWNHLHALHVKSSSGLECGVVGINVKPPTVDRRNGGLSVFVASTISNERSIGAYYGPIVCTDRSENLLSIKECS